MGLFDWVLDFLGLKKTNVEVERHLKEAKEESALPKKIRDILSRIRIAIEDHRAFFSTIPYGKNLKGKREIIWKNYPEIVDPMKLRVIEMQKTVNDIDNFLSKPLVEAKLPKKRRDELKEARDELNIKIALLRKITENLQ